MATIKSYTDIEQSRKLTEILPLESADMHYNDWTYDFYDGYEHTGEYLADLGTPKTICGELDIPCWSLAGLLDVLPNENMLVKTTDGEYYCLAKDVMTKHYDNPLDACAAMIEKLHELKML